MEASMARSQDRSGRSARPLERDTTRAQARGTVQRPSAVAQPIDVLRAATVLSIERKRRRLRFRVHCTGGRFVVP
jgi:hypothetical protein